MVTIGPVGGGSGCIALLLDDRVAGTFEPDMEVDLPSSLHHSIRVYVVFVYQQRNIQKDPSGYSGWPKSQSSSVFQSKRSPYLFVFFKKKFSIFVLVFGDKLVILFTPQL